VDKKTFDELVESMEEMGEIVRGERKPAREFVIRMPPEDYATESAAS
jgi:hypothetical protein